MQQHFGTELLYGLHIKTGPLATRSEKKCCYALTIICQVLTDCQNSLTFRLGSKVIIQDPNMLEHLLLHYLVKYLASF